MPLPASISVNISEKLQSIENKIQELQNNGSINNGSLGVTLADPRIDEISNKLKNLQYKFWST